MALPEIPRGHGAGLAGFLHQAGLTRDFIYRMTEPVDNLRVPLVATREACLSGHPAAALLRLLFCRETMPAETAPDEVRAFLSEASAGAVVSHFHLRLAGGLYLFSDYLDDSEPDAVMGAGETTAILYRAARPQQKIGRALDLGCGAGTLALLLAGDADHATGTDVNARAVAMGRWNALVNGIGNVDFREGSLYDPVAGERFDVIVSQPPYYPKPASGELRFLHGGERGDELARAVVDGAPEHLTSSGRALVFASWAERSAMPELPGYDLLDIHTNRREPHGGRQSVTVIRPGSGWTSEFEVSSEYWGRLRRVRVEQLLAMEDLLRGPAETLAAARFRLPEGTAILDEDGQRVLRYPPDWLIGWVPVSDAVWAVISNPAAADPEALKQAVRRGLLTLA